MYPAKLTPLLSFCTYVTRSIDPNQRKTPTSSAQQYLIQTNQPKKLVVRKTSYICDTLSWILRMEKLQPETLPDLFPDLQMVVTNTYNHTSDKPRFRAVLFTDEPMTVEVYGLIYNAIADSLAAAFKTAFERLSGSNAFGLMPDPLFFTFARLSLPPSIGCLDDDAIRHEAKLL
jgi:hypothetical protein